MDEQELEALFTKEVREDPISHLIAVQVLLKSAHGVVSITCSILTCIYFIHVLIMFCKCFVCASAGEGV